MDDEHFYFLAIQRGSSGRFREVLQERDKSYQPFEDCVGRKKHGHP
jgi:hypothetical protein